MLTPTQQAAVDAIKAKVAHMQDMIAADVRVPAWPMVERQFAEIQAALDELKQTQ